MAYIPATENTSLSTLDTLVIFPLCFALSMEKSPKDIKPNILTPHALPSLPSFSQLVAGMDSIVIP